MTRNFNPQKRDGARPPFRDTSSFNTSNGQEGYSQRPGRPRLNRASIDRAWQNGAQRSHPDYRPRTSGNNSFNAPSNGQYSRPNHHNGAYNNNNRSNYQAGPHSGSAPHPHAHQASYQERRHSFGNGNTSNYKPNFARRRPETQDWEPGQERHSSHGGPRSHHSTSRRPFSNRAERGPAPQQRYTSQFEGDYESYSYQDRPRHQGDYQQRSHHRSEYTQGENYQKPERHVTRMPDGRTLKGPRPVQRRNAQFWSEIADDTEGLLEGVTPQEPTETAPGKKSRSAATTPKQKPAQARKPRAPKGEKAERPHARGSRPSQRGYKWPTKD